MKPSILVSGLINFETTLQVEGFPIEYSPVRFPFFGVNSSVSGVGYNVTKALYTLGNEVYFLSILGRDFAGRFVRKMLIEERISDRLIISSIDLTAQSVILFDKSGQRQINVDLKNIQECAYPQESFERVLSACSLTVLCNINFSRPFLSCARQAGLLVATDVHTISDLEDPYNRDFMQAADILFMSDERLPCPPKEWIQRVQDRFGTEIIVIGLGDKGALLAVRGDHTIDHIPAVKTRPVVNTIGAGDALFSSFVHFYNQKHDAYAALHKAIVFASWKIGEKGAAEGFLDEIALERLIQTL